MPVTFAAVDVPRLANVTVAATPIEVHTAAVDAWSNAHVAGVDGILLAGTRSEAGALNRIARARVASELSGPVLEVHGRHFQAGDRVVIARRRLGRSDDPDTVPFPRVRVRLHAPRRSRAAAAATAAGRDGSALLLMWLRARWRSRRRR